MGFRVVVLRSFFFFFNNSQQGSLAVVSLGSGPSMAQCNRYYLEDGRYWGISQFLLHVDYESVPHFFLFLLLGISLIFCFCIQNWQVRGSSPSSDALVFCSRLKVVIFLMNLECYTPAFHLVSHSCCLLQFPLPFHTSHLFLQPRIRRFLLNL